MKTEFPSPKDISRSWHVLDAADLPLGRVATQTARLLMGKHKPTFTPFLDTGDHVIILNAAKVRLTGRKEDQKVYRRHSGFPGGLAEVGARKLRATRPTQLVFEAVSGMLPKTKLGKHMLRKLRVYPGDKHPHQAQKPVAMMVGSR